MISGAILLAWAVGAALAEEPTASQVAKLAHEAEKAGLIVRAWELYREAARMDPTNPSYRTHVDALESNAKMMVKFGLQEEGKSLGELKKDALGEKADTGDATPALDLLIPSSDLQPPPKLKPITGTHSFDIRGDEKALYAQVARTFGFKVVFDPAFAVKSGLQFHVDDVDLHDTLEALTAATGTFVFPMDSETIFVAKDDQQKRTEFEPVVALTVPMPEATDPKEVNEAVAAVKGLFQVQRIMEDGAARTVIIRDRVSHAYVVRALLENLLVPKPQVSIEFQLLGLDESKTAQYGVALPTSYPIVNLGMLKHFQTMLNIPTGFTSFLTFGGGATLFGIAIANTDIFAISSQSWTRVLYDGSVLAGNGQPVNFFVGDKYPIATALNTASSQGGVATVFPSTTQEDLGITVKATPHIGPWGEVMLEVDVSYKTLGTLTLNTVPEINERQFKGSVQLLEGEQAVIAGMDSESLTVTRNGILGLEEIPWVNQFLGLNTRDREKSRAMIVVKPVITRPPAYQFVHTDFATGSENGERVLL